MSHSKKSFLRASAVAAALWVLSNLPAFAQAPHEQLVFVGSGHRNIYSFQLDMTSGSLTPNGKVADIGAPSYLAISPNHRNLYAISEGQTSNTSFVTSFQLDLSSGKLTSINQEETGGAGPCYVEVDSSGRNVLVANYNSGSVAVFPIWGIGALAPMSSFVQDTGASVNLQRQSGPHAHCIVTDPTDKYALVCDLGLDKVMIFNFDPLKGTLQANTLPYVSMRPGEGPRHIAFHPNGKSAYVINELASTLTSFFYDSGQGSLTEMQEFLLLPHDFKGLNSAAEVAVHPSGRYVYASNRGEDCIVIFACDPTSGRLTYLERVSTEGRTPRHFEIDPSGTYLLAADQDSNVVVVFSIDMRTGHLAAVGRAQVDAPMCVKCIVPASPITAPSPVGAPETPAAPANPLAPLLRPAPAAGQ